MTGPISVDQLTEAVTNGVLRALNAQRASDNAVSIEQMIDRGIFSQIVVTAGNWPTGRDPFPNGVSLPNTIVGGPGAPS
jgi:hypothetical protein